LCYQNRQKRVSKSQPRLIFSFQCTKVSDQGPLRFANSGHKNRAGSFHVTQTRPLFPFRPNQPQPRGTSSNGGGYNARFQGQMMNQTRPAGMHSQEKTLNQKTCWICQRPNHTAKACPQRQFCLPNCIFCGKQHAQDVSCPSSGRPNTAFSAQAGRIQFDSRFVIPTFINGVSVTTLRDNGHSGTLLVDHSLVSRDQFVAGRTIRLKGAFNNEFVELPIARVLFRSPNLGCTREIEIEAAVTNMPSVFYCNIGNALFEQYPKLTDIIHCKVHQADRAPNPGHLPQQDRETPVLHLIN